MISNVLDLASQDDNIGKYGEKCFRRFVRK